MKTRTMFMLLLGLAPSLSCSNNKTEQLSGADSLALEEPATDIIPATPADLPQPSDSTIQILTLQWQNVSMSEYGAVYEFIDNKGNPLSYSILNIPGFDFQKNEFFEATYAEGAQFPTIKMNERTKTTWYRVTIKEEYREENGAGGEFSVITAIEPLTN